MQVNQTSLKSLGPALLRAQKKITSVVKEANNPFFKSKYASLENVMEACKEQLNSEGIVVLQPVGFDLEGNYVETQLLHAESGESVSSRMRLILSKNDMQNLGSSISYARRYTLQSLVFLGAADDDAEGSMNRSISSPSVSKSERPAFKPKSGANAPAPVANGSKVADNGSEW